MTNIENIVLAVGSHDPGPDMCLMEAVAYVAGEPWTDHPVCASPVLAAYGRALNDGMPDDQRQRLIPLIPRLIGTAGDGHDRARAFLAADTAVRVFAARALEYAGRRAEASTLRDLPKVTDRRTADAANAAAYAATAYGAAAAAANVAYAAAAYDAATAAASYTYAATNAAAAAAAAAARDSAIDLFERMINP